MTALISRQRLLGMLILTLPLAACAKPSPSADGAAASVVVPAIAQSTAPQIVTGLPDFTKLVEAVGPGVVNIEAKTTARSTRAGGLPPGMDEEEVPEFFRRFFGPGFPQQPQPREGISMGSGFIISPDGYVLTNHHVIDGADTVTVKLTDKREFKATVVGSDAQYDVAVLKVDAKDLPSIRIGDSNLLKPGQWVVAIGSPLGFANSVTAGIVSAVGRSTGNEQRYVPFIQTDVAINRGNSGGPLLNTSGEVVGINSQIYSNSGGYMGISFAIPIDLAISAAEQIKKTGKVSRGMLGVTVQQIGADDAKGWRLPDTRGAQVTAVNPGSAADKAGIENGDVILSVDGRVIDGSEQLPQLIGAMAPGTKVTLGVWRDGKQRNLTVTLDALEGDEGAAAAEPASSAEPAKPAAGKSRLLGLEVSGLDEATRKRLGLDKGEGIRITGVEGSARDARLQPGLLITQVGRTKVGSVADFDKALAKVKAGDVVMLLVRSPNGGSQFVAVTASED